MPYFLLVLGLIQLIVVLVVASQLARTRMEDTAKALWMLNVMLVPIVGAIAWWIAGRPATVVAPID